MRVSMSNPNHLIQEVSPYLQQHAHNPVDWYPWGPEALQKALTENKPLLISIGYSSCHWCHVMERESFEDESIAALMNQHFVCIKVDREERPDIDQVYMLAVQLIRGQGGWPLHAFAFADGRHFYGGTYFRPEQWTETLEQIAEAFATRTYELNNQAVKIAREIKSLDFNFATVDHSRGDLADIHKSIASWERSFDSDWGGMAGAPKFPVPVNFLLLLRYAKATSNGKILDFVRLSLRKMAYGGIYDQLGGGFARYSADSEWRMPHFEKMLYDNAQLVSLYSEAYQLTRDEEFRDVVYQTLDFVARELSDISGAFYSALDADSEGEEGRFYTWTIQEIQKVLQEDEALFTDYYYGEGQGKDVLHRKTDIHAYAKEAGLSYVLVEEKLRSAREKMFSEREKRPHPGLDDKTLTSWNALMAKAYFNAYAVFGEERFFQLGKKNLDFLMETCRRNDGGLWHRYKNGNAGIPAFLEDYAFLIEVLLAYPAGHDNRYLYQAKTLMHMTMAQFFDPVQGLFYFTSNEGESLFARKADLADNVIPSSNSSLCRSLFRLGLIFHENSFLNTSRQMMLKMRQKTLAHPGFYSNWAIAYLEDIVPFHTVAVAGNDAVSIIQQLNQHYLPFTFKVASKEDCFVPLLQNRIEMGKTVIHICNEEGCLLPTEDVTVAMKMLGETI